MFSKQGSTSPGVKLISYSTDKYKKCIVCVDCTSKFLVFKSLVTPKTKRKKQRNVWDTHWPQKGKGTDGFVLRKITDSVDMSFREIISNHSYPSGITCYCCVGTILDMWCVCVCVFTSSIWCVGLIKNSDVTTTELLSADARRMQIARFKAQRLRW